MKFNISPGLAGSVVFAVATFAAPVVLAQGGDSSASASAGFHDEVVTSGGVIVRVPFNARGEENTSATEMRLTGERLSTDQPEAITGAFDSATAVPSAAVVDTSTSADSSTSYYGWNGYNYRGWQQPSYYYNYSPRYNYGNYAYNYRYGYNYSYNFPSSYYSGYNYYYYPRNYYTYGGYNYRWNY